MSKTYHRTNFFKHTYCEFEYQSEAILNEQDIHFTSKSGSSYVYTEKGVYRYSNHWGRVANCRWKLNGVGVYENQKYYVGYANWDDFYSLTSNEKAFYLSVDIAEEVISIGKCTKETDEEVHLLNLAAVFRKQKEIVAVLNNTKWMQYYDEDVEELQKKVIHELVNSDKTLQQIKFELSSSIC